MLLGKEGVYRRKGQAQMSTESSIETINGHLFPALRRFSARPMQIHRGRTWTYGQAADAIHGVARFLRQKGIEPGDRVAIVAENRPRWFHVFAGCLAVGAVAVPRGEDIAVDELQGILEHAGCRHAFTGSERAHEMLPDGLSATRMDGDDFPAPEPCGEDDLATYGDAAASKDLAVLLYTSGTTGRPKGVMLEHKNIAHNLRHLPEMVGMQPGDVWVTILPAWHTFEQTVELCGIISGNAFVYSDKRRLKHDLKEHRPHFFAAVPRVWEALHRGACDAIEKKGRVVGGLFRAAYGGTRRWREGNPLGLPLHGLGTAMFYKKIRNAVGGRLKHGISGGGALPLQVDRFFLAIGVDLLVGYGLTETAPVVALRDPDDNVAGTIGRAVPETEIRVGEAGTFQVRGPQVMRGYYRDEELTRAVLDDEGWFDTGDLGEINGKGDLVFRGRAKETIVMAGGENVEPEPIEHRVLEVPGVHQAMVVGQDKKTLGALVVRDPENERPLEELRADVREATSDLRSFETIHRVAIIDEPFTVENGLLTPTLKMKRNDVAKRYAQEIDALYE